MTPVDRTPAYLWDMIDAIDQLQSYVQGKTYEDYQYDNVSQAQLWEIFQTRLSPLRQKLAILLDSLVP